MNTKRKQRGGEEEKNCHLKFKNERNFLHSPYYPPTHLLCLFIPNPYFPSPKLTLFFPPLSLSPSLYPRSFPSFPPCYSIILLSSLFVLLYQFPIHYLHPPFHLLLLSFPPYFLALSFPSVFDITYQLYFSVNAFSYSISWQETLTQLK